jgi:DNA-nicking Smr family endonuclease
VSRRGLEDQERALWGRVIASVKPLHPVRPVAVKAAIPAKSPPAPIAKPKSTPRKAVAATPVKLISKPAGLSPPNNLDGSWDRRIGKGAIVPDVSVDLHGSGLSSAYTRLDGALEQAIAQRMRVILLVTGKARSHDRASGQGRGAIAAVVRDWLASSRHASAISAVRGAHPRHGGSGALYIVLKR